MAHSRRRNRHDGGLDDAKGWNAPAAPDTALVTIGGLVMLFMCYIIFAWIAGSP
jgi:hypothetical protein